MGTHADGDACKIEFTALKAKTAAVVAVEPANVRPFGDRKINRARELAAS